MNIGILGGGVTGLTAAYKLKNKHTITLFEAAPTVGGLAQGFKKEGWDWHLDNTYHHVFSNDADILSLGKEVGTPFSFYTPKTQTIFGAQNNYRIYPVDSPKDILLLPELSLLARLRVGAVAAMFKLTPFLSLYEQHTAHDFLMKTMGREAWGTMWGPLFRKKFGKYAEKIVTSFIWARIKKRTRMLGYPDGGFQRFVDDLESALIQGGVVVKKATRVEGLTKERGTFRLNYKNEKGERVDLEFDKIISTLPYPIFLKVAKTVLPQSYIDEQSKRKYLWAVNLIVESNDQILDNTYWLNVNAKDIPVMCVVQHTNFIDKKHYGNKHIAYFAWYVDEGDPLLHMSEQEVFGKVKPVVDTITKNAPAQLNIVRLARAPFAQPIFDSEFVTLDRSMHTPVAGLLNSNLDLTYPFDRGTNYAVELGVTVSNLILHI